MTGLEAVITHKTHKVNALTTNTNLKMRKCIYISHIHLETPRALNGLITSQKTYTLRMVKPLVLTHYTKPLWEVLLRNLTA